MSVLSIFTSFHGRIGRLEYWIASLCLNPLGVVFERVMHRIDHPSVILVVALAAMSALLMWMALATNIQRLHDRNMSGWWLLLIFVPVLGPLALLVIVGFLPGTSGPNRYPHLVLRPRIGTGEGAGPAQGQHGVNKT
jgi:uncharacterized membrane protein YhaH (DUF805 family)